MKPIQFAGAASTGAFLATLPTGWFADGERVLACYAIALTLLIFAAEYTRVPPARKLPRRASLPTKIARRAGQHSFSTPC